MKKSTHTIVAATDRSAKVVFALKRYFHHNCTGENLVANLTEGIETILTIDRNQLKRGVEVLRNYEAKLPQLLRYPDELNQVRTNLIRNPIGATDNCGVLTVEARQENPSILVSATDTAKEIPPEILLAANI